MLKDIHRQYHCTQLQEKIDFFETIKYPTDKASQENQAHLQENHEEEAEETNDETEEEANEEEEQQEQ